MYQRKDKDGNASENDIVRAHSNMGFFNPCSPRPKRCQLAV